MLGVKIVCTPRCIRKKRTVATQIDNLIVELIGEDAVKIGTLMKVTVKIVALRFWMTLRIVFVYSKMK